MRTIDAYCHVLPREYHEAIAERSGGDYAISRLHEQIPALTDVTARIELMDRHSVDEQILVPASPAVETMADRTGAAELARIANDGVADIVSRHPDRFRGVATVPMNNPQAMLEELDRAVAELDMAGVLLYSSVDDRAASDGHVEGAGRPIDLPQLEPFYERVAHHDVPVWLHPSRPRTNPDYVGELDSKYLIWQMYGWPFELSAAMSRLVFSGLMERYDLTVIAHHAGSLLPLLAGRMPVHYELFESAGEPVGDDLSRPYADHFRQFYADTVTFGNVPALRAAYEFFGPDHLLFGTDAPFDTEGGDRSTASNLEGLYGLEIPDAERERIAAGNVERLLG